MISYPCYAQGDQRWASRALRTALFKKKGCLVTALASKLAGESGMALTPIDVDSFLDSHGGYAKGVDNVIWDVFNKFALIHGVNYKSVKFTKYIGTEPRGTIVMVRTPWFSSHFVLLLDYTDGRIMDPAIGSETTFALRKYKPRECRVL